ncbi:MAG: response regulator transcription factor [Pyrinomonadaceae bacterium]
MHAKKEIKVMIVGDFLIFRSGLKLLLEKEEKIKFVGEAADLVEASGSVHKLKPDIILIDSAETDDANFTTFLDAPANDTPIIVLTNVRDAEKQKKYLMLGVNGLVSKEETTDVLINAINQVTGGDVHFDRRLMSETIKQLVSERKALPENLNSLNCALLTDREREVLILVCRGMKNKIVAEQLFITETTVRHHLTSIFEKLKVSSRLELVVHAFREKLVDIPLRKPEAVSAGNYV